MTDQEQLQLLLDQAETDDLYEEEAQEFILERGIKYLSHSRKYLINLAFNNGWRPENSSSSSSSTTPSEQHHVYLRL